MSCPVAVKMPKQAQNCLYIVELTSIEILVFVITLSGHFVRVNLVLVRLLPKMAEI